MSGPERSGATAAELLAVYDEQLRGESEVLGARSWDQDGPLWRAVHGHGALVTYRSLDGLDRADLERLVARALAHLSADPATDSVEWKTRGHDRDAVLLEVLAGAGFVAEEVETVMVGEASALVAAAPEPPAGVVVRRVDQLPDRAALLEAAADLQCRVFGRAGSGADLLARVERAEGRTEVWVAEDADGVVVCTGRLEVVPGTQCAGLWGGATLPGWRGRGVYRALTGARADSAVSRGVRWLHSDCTAMSRPILERSGLVAVTTTTPWVWHRG